MPRTVKVYDEYAFGFSLGARGGDAADLARARRRRAGRGSSTRSPSTRRSTAPPALGEIAGVLQLLDRHNRDCAPLAERFGVPHC